MEHYFRHGLAESSRRSYNSAKKRYVDFCSDAGFLPVPASEHQLCQFVSHMADVGLKHKTIKCYLSAVRHLHLEEKLPDPGLCNMARLEHVLRGVKSLQAKQGSQSKPRLPITPTILLKLRKVWDSRPTDKDRIMLWAASCICFFGFMRAGEITVLSDTAYDASTHLSVKDVSVDSKSNPGMVKLHLKASKTDPFRQGVDIFVGKTTDRLCPVAALLSYIAVRGYGEGPLFIFSDGRFLTRDRFVAKVREAMSLAGLNYNDYSGHSFRIGAATTAAQKGISDSTIKMLGRWKSSAYALYIKTPRDHLAKFSTTLVSEDK